MKGVRGCTVSDTVRVRDLWPFPVGLGNLWLSVALGSGCLAILLGARPACQSRRQASSMEPVTADSPAWPCDWLLRSAAPDREGGPTLPRSCSQDISGPFMGTGRSGAHATLSSVVVSLMLAYPHSSALDPCSSRFSFDCDLLPSHGGPQLSTLDTCFSLSFLSRRG